MSELLTVSEVATVLKCSEDTIVRRFSKVKGVIDLGVGETRNKRRYRVLRIPASVVGDTVFDASIKVKKRYMRMGKILQLGEVDPEVAIAAHGVYRINAVHAHSSEFQSEQK